MYKTIIKNRTIRHIVPGIIYENCCIYQDGNTGTYVCQNSFDKCTFRTDVYFTDMQYCIFKDCTFNGNVSIDISREPITDHFHDAYAFPYWPWKDITALYMRETSPYTRDDQGMTYIPEAVAEMTSLKVLDACFCKLDTESLSPLSGMESLKCLALNGNNISEINDHILSLKNLEYLSLYKNDISLNHSALSSLSELKNLQYIDIGGNSVSWSRGVEIKNVSMFFSERDFLMHCDILYNDQLFPAIERKVSNV